jgi:hypothetical protein
MALHRRGELQAARTAFDASLALEPGNTHALAFKSITLHELGDLRAERELVDVERFLRATSIPVPEGYANINDFNADLSEYATRQCELSKKEVRREGVTRELFADPEGPVVALKAAIHSEVERYIDSLPSGTAHPFIARQPNRFRIIGWANVLRDNANIHIHPGAWLSGTYYARTRDLAGGVSGQPTGGIGFGPPDSRFTNAKDFVLHTVEAEEGKLLLFPSYFWHGVLPFESLEPRISYAFDVATIE